MTTSQKTEDSTTAAAAAGTPGTASNLPRPPGKSSSGAGGVSRKTESIAYQTSRLVRHTRVPQGQIKHMSLSVLVDNDLKWQGSGKKIQRVLVPPTPERLKAIHDIVAGIAGLNTERGDQLVVESQPFESTLNAEPPLPQPAAPSADPRVPKWLVPIMADPKSLTIAVAAGAGIVLLIGVLAFLLLRGKKKVPLAASQTALPDAHEAPVASGLSDEERISQMNTQLAEQAELQKQMDEGTLNQLRLPNSTSQKSEVLARHLRETIKKDSAATANVLRTWLSEPVGGRETT